MTSREVSCKASYFADAVFSSSKTVLGNDTIVSIMGTQELGSAERNLQLQFGFVTSRDFWLGSARSVI